MTIWKFSAHVADKIEWLMPMGAQPLCVGMQGDQLCLWALVDPREPLRNYRFFVYGTGHPIENAECYIGTAFDPRGFVWHVFGE